MKNKSNIVIALALAGTIIPAIAQRQDRGNERRQPDGRQQQRNERNSQPQNSRRDDSRAQRNAPPEARRQPDRNGNDRRANRPPEKNSPETRQPQPDARRRQDADRNNRQGGRETPPPNARHDDSRNQRRDAERNARPYARRYAYPPRTWHPARPAFVIHLPFHWPPLWPIPHYYYRPYLRMNIPFDMRHALEISERPWTVLSCEPADYADSGYDPDLTLSVQDDLGRGEVFTISPFHAFYDTFWELMAGDRIRFIFGANGYDRNNDWWDSAVMHLRPIVLDRY